MIISEPVGLHEPQRQSLWAILFLALRTIRQLGFVQIALGIGFVISRLPSLLYFALLASVLAVLLLGIAALQWWRYTFQVVNDELVVRRGVLAQQNLSIPMDRVQSVALEQKLLHRIVSLVQITLDTAGSATAEFVIDAVDRPIAVALQREVARHRGRTTTDAAATEVANEQKPPETIVVQHSWRRIVQVALTQLPFAGLVVIGPLVAAGDDIGRVLPFDLPEIEDPGVGPWLYWAIPLLLVVVVAVSVLLNLMRVLLSEWNLTLRATATGLRRNAGLLSTTSVAATIPRIQVIQVRQRVLERLASLHTVTLRTIGVSRLAVPGCKTSDVAAVRSLALGDSAGVVDLERRVAQADVFRVTRNGAVGAGLVALAGWFLVGWWSLLALAVIPVVWLVIRRSVNRRRWAMTRDAVADRRELFGWRRDEMLLRKINVVTVRQTLFERKRGLATVNFRSAGGNVSIGMIPVTEAEALRDRAILHVETDRGAWM